MEFKAFVEDILGKIIHIGDTVWICDFRHDDIMNKPIRNISPQAVVIADNADLPKGKIVYYSNVHFLPLGKNGSPQKKVIAPFDNTGFRGRTGIGVNVFDTEKECREFYLTQCNTVKTQIEEARKDSMARFDAMEAELAKSIKDHGS
jgi:hypothetical protein